MAAPVFGLVFEGPEGYGDRELPGRPRALTPPTTGWPGVRGGGTGPLRLGQVTELTALIEPPGTVSPTIEDVMHHCVTVRGSRLSRVSVLFPNDIAHTARTNNDVRRRPCPDSKTRCTCST